MTVLEFSNEFDIHYDNIMSKSAPGLDLYEKSVFLTKGQLEIVKSHANPLGNKYRKGFEGSEKRREDLKELIRNYNVSTPIQTAEGIDPSSSFFEIPSNTYIILQEAITILSSNTNINNTKIKVIPKTHDEYNVQIENPFKMPDRNKAWRLDFSMIGNKKVVEILSAYTIKEYKLRYLKVPAPIILTDISAGDFLGMGLSIDGKTASQTCELSTSIHREILDRAVELAVRDYKPAELQPKVQLDMRNE